MRICYSVYGVLGGRGGIKKEGGRDNNQTVNGKRSNL